MPRGHLLIVDDEVSILTTLRTALSLEGYDVDESGPQGSIQVQLKYVADGVPAITGIERVSRPGRRIYRGKDEIPKVLNGLGVTIMSTNRGVMTGAASEKSQVGGEVLCSIW